MKSCDNCAYSLSPYGCRLNVEAECGAGEYECWEPGTIGAMLEVTEAVVIV